MYVNCDYYRVFYYVAKYGSLSQAARLLLAGQPNLTRAIRNPCSPAAVAECV